MEKAILLFAKKDITNTLGEGGTFSIKDSENVFVTVDQATGNVIMGGKVGVGHSSPDAELAVNGYTKLGNDAPKIKMKKIVGVTGESDSLVCVMHGLDSTKIIGVQGLVHLSPGTGYTQSVNMGFPTWAYHYDSENIYVTTDGKSSQYNHKPFTVLITYEE